MGRREMGGDAAGQGRVENPRVGMVRILMERSVLSYPSMPRRTFSRYLHTKFIPHTLKPSGPSAWKRTEQPCVRRKLGAESAS